MRLFIASQQALCFSRYLASAEHKNDFEHIIHNFDSSLSIATTTRNLGFVNNVDVDKYPGQAIFFGLFKIDHRQWSSVYQDEQELQTQFTEAFNQTIDFAQDSTLCVPPGSFTDGFTSVFGEPFQDESYTEFIDSVLQILSGL